MAFTQNTVPTFPKQPQINRVQIAPADAQNQKTGYTAGANGSKIIGVIIASSDTSARDVQMSITNGGTSYPIMTKTVPLSAGFVAGTAAVNFLDPVLLVGMPVDNDGNPYLYLISGDTLTFSALTTVTAAKLITIHVIAADF
jgi:hypothetical protein